MVRKLTIVIGLATATALSGGAVQAEEIKLGGLLETSGFLASLGKPGLEGAMLAVDQVNRAGGINGNKVKFTNINTESNNTLAVSAAKRLIEQYKVVGIIGAMNSGSSYAIISTVQRVGLPVIANGGSRGIVLPPDRKRWMFLAPLTDVLVQSVMMKDMRKRGITKVALLNADSGFGTSGRKQLEKYAAKFGITIAIQQTYGNRDKDMTAQLTKIRASAAQATVLWGTGPGQAIATKNHRQLGIKTPLYLSHASNDFNYIRLSGPSANGVLLPSSKLYVVDSLPNSDPQKSVIARFVKDYKAKYGRLPATFAGNGYDATMMMMQAIKRAGTDGAKLRNAIETTKNYVGVTAVYSYSPNDHFGAQASSVVMLTVNNGKFVLAK